MERTRKPYSVKIGLDVERDRNRELLTRLFSECDIIGFSGGVPGRTDLCIIDVAALERTKNRFETWVTQQSPVFAPIVLLVEENQSNELMVSELPDYIDAVCRIPMPKAELSTRINNLLEMRELSKELDEERKLTELIFDEGPLAKLVLEPDKTIVRANKRAEEVFGIDQSTLIGQQYNSGNWAARYADGKKIPTEELPFTQLRETKQSVNGFEHIQARPGHHDLWVSVNMSPILYDSGEIAYVVVVIEDITSRKKRQKELEQMTNAVDKAPIGIVLSDPTQKDNPLVYVNEGFVEQTGYTREEALGRNCRFLQGEDTNEEIVDTLRQKIEAEEPVSVVIQNYRADGSAYWNRLEVAPVPDRDGNVVNYIGFQQDVTALVERQRHLQILDRYLRHNIRNKMNVINGIAEVIQDEADPQIADYAKKINKTSSTLLGNTEREREVVKLLQEESEPIPVELMSLLRVTLNRLSEEYPSVAFSLSGPTSVSVNAVPEISKACEELIRNAIKHNKSDSPRVDITVKSDTETVQLDIVDNGPGIPEVEIEVLSDMDAESPVNHGQGLGLWLVYLIVNHSGGELDFAERQLDGSNVSVKVPRKAENSQ